jgi:hypothetical protein
VGRGGSAYGVGYMPRLRSRAVRAARAASPVRDQKEGGMGIDAVAFPGSGYTRRLRSDRTDIALVSE